MALALFVVALIWFAAIAPAHLTAFVLVLMLAVVTVVRFSTNFVTGATTSYTESFKAVGLAFVFVLLALFTIISFTKGAAPLAIVLFSGPMMLLLPVAYFLGFKIALGVSFLASIVIAIISAVASTGLFLVAKTLFLG
ncbi:MAG: hypothetical protein REI94_19525 [Moraxellaceae bacterium]|nr:hypothetical protein [Moraxellaceae bacterium]